MKSLDEIPRRPSELLSHVGLKLKALKWLMAQGYPSNKIFMEYRIRRRKLDRTRFLGKWGYIVDVVAFGDGNKYPEVLVECGNVGPEKLASLKRIFNKVYVLGYDDSVPRII